MAKPDYDTTLARIAGNIASGLADRLVYMRDSLPAAMEVDVRAMAFTSVAIARAIVAEVKRTEPAAQ